MPIRSLLSTYFQRIETLQYSFPFKEHTHTPNNLNLQLHRFSFSISLFQSNFIWLSKQNKSIETAFHKVQKHYVYKKTSNRYNKYELNTKWSKCYNKLVERSIWVKVESLNMKRIKYICNNIYYFWLINVSVNVFICGENKWHANFISNQAIYLNRISVLKTFTVVEYIAFH